VPDSLGRRVKPRHCGDAAVRRGSDPVQICSVRKRPVCARAGIGYTASNSKRDAPGLPEIFSSRPTGGEANASHRDAARIETEDSVISRDPWLRKAAQSHIQRAALTYRRGIGATKLGVRGQRPGRHAHVGNFIYRRQQVDIGRSGRGGAGRRGQGEFAPIGPRRECQRPAEVDGAAGSRAPRPREGGCAISRCRAAEREIPAAPSTQNGLAPAASELRRTLSPCLYTSVNSMSARVVVQLRGPFRVGVPG
jgi:hypothetical protein